MKYSDQKIGIIGLGSMSTAICKGLLGKGGIEPSNVTASARNWDRLKARCDKMGIVPAHSASEVVSNSDVVLIGVIPEQVENVLGEVGPMLPGKLVISIAYGITHDLYMQKLPKGCHVICTVPNTPVEIGKGIFVCSNEHSLTDDQLELFNDLIGRIAHVEMLPPELLDLGGIIAGSTPAFMDVIIESLADAAVLQGMPRDTSYRLVERMMEGSAAYAFETGEHPGVLKDAVCSPGGATIKGIASLEQSALRGAMIKAINEIMK